ncbi:MAG TPA: YqiA/YcfP family alpha/beta fold hydrolase [Bryobacteraceae bacterium]|nr:YqiA/YcfP family alpha/beta fold hydrolase [Bryobacteraceae bacterium]
MKYIYLHGFASGPDSTKARYFRDRFATGAPELLAPDLAAGDFEHLTISGQLGVVERIAAGEAAVLIGSSMGGYLAALYAARHPEVAKLVLMAPAFGFARRWPASMGAERLEDWRRTGWLETWHWAEKRTRRLSFALIEDGARYEDNPGFTQPALIFHGSRDETVPLSYSVDFAAAHPNAKLRTFDSGHDLVDVIDRIWTETREFLGLPPGV